MKAMRNSPGGEFRLVERCPSRVRGFPVTTTTPDTVGAVEGGEAACATVWTGAFLPDRLETPLDDGVRRLGAKFYSPSSASSASLWPKVGRSSCIPVFAGAEALILLVPPVY
jgi:hypothetical protein